MDWLRLFELLGAAGVGLVAGLGMLWFVGKKMIDHLVAETLESHKGEIQKDVEARKAELQADLEEKRGVIQRSIEEQRIAATAGIEEKRSAFQRTLEHEKAAFAQTSEVLRHELQRKAFAAELHAKQIHVLYPRLSLRMHKAVGAVGGLFGLKESPDYEHLEGPVLQARLEKMGVEKSHASQVVENLVARKHNSVNDLRRLLRRVDIRDAKLARENAHNFLVTKRLYLPKPVFEKGWAINVDMISIVVDTEMVNEHGPIPGSDGMKTYNLTKKITDDMAELDLMLQKELLPQP